MHFPSNIFVYLFVLSFCHKYKRSIEFALFLKHAFTFFVVVVNYCRHSELQKVFRRLRENSAEEVDTHSPVSWKYPSCPLLRVSLSWTSYKYIWVYSTVCKGTLPATVPLPAAETSARYIRARHPDSQPVIHPGLYRNICPFLFVIGQRCLCFHTHT